MWGRRTGSGRVVTLHNNLPETQKATPKRFLVSRNPKKIWSRVSSLRGGWGGGYWQWVWWRASCSLQIRADIRSTYFFISCILLLMFQVLGFSSSTTLLLSSLELSDTTVRALLETGFSKIRALLETGFSDPVDVLFYLVRGGARPLASGEGTT